MNASTVLKGSGRDGDFVHESQEMASKQGFRNVSKSWYDKTWSYEQGMEHLESEVGEREDIVCKPKDMVPTFNAEDGTIRFEYSDGRQFQATAHAMRQYATWTHIPHTFINKMLEGQVLKQNGDVLFKRDDADMHTLWVVLKNGHRRMNKDKDFRFRTYKNGTLRAVLSKLYAPIDNRWYLEQIKQLIPGGRLSHFDFSTGDTFNGNVLIPDTIREEDDSDYGGMISLGNCEIGLRRFEQYPSVFRAICMNGCIWDQSKGYSISQVHKGKIDLKKLAKRIEDNIQKQIPILNKGIDLMFNLRDYDFGDIPARSVLAQIAKDTNMSGVQTIKLYENYNKFGKVQKNAFGIVDALTRSGQEFGADRWLQYDKAAGDIVAGGEEYWNKILKKAENIEDKDIEKMLKRGERKLLAV